MSTTDEIERQTEAFNAALAAVAARVTNREQPLEEILIAASGVVHDPKFAQRFVDEPDEFDLDSLPPRSVGGVSGAW